MKHRPLLLTTCGLLGLLAPSAAWANFCAAPTSRENVSTSGVVNSYFPITVPYTAGTTTMTIGPARSDEGAPTTPLQIGDLALVIQPQDATITTTGNGSAAGYTTAGTSYGRNDGSFRGSLPAQSAKFEFIRVTGGSAGGVSDGAIGNSNGGALTFTQGISSSGLTFVVGPFASGQISRIRSGQVIRIPQVANMTLTGKLTAPSFKELNTVHNNAGGSPQAHTGGVVVLDVAGTLDFNGQTIDVSGLGFRGGLGRALSGGTAGLPTITDYNRPSMSYTGFTAVNVHGSKGEGTAGTPRNVVNSRAGAITGPETGAPNPIDGYPNGSLGRGAPGNAGGGGTDQILLTNSGNTGGGGGAGGGGSSGTTGDGGKGADYDSDGAGATTAGGGGLGGVGIRTGLYSGGTVPTRNYQIASFGGGGGAGSNNDGTTNTSVTLGNGTSITVPTSSGGNGGGVVIIRAARITGSGSVKANGTDAPDETNDAGGGGGGGGWIILAAGEQQSTTTAPTLTLEARGGNGGDGTAGGGGGGGGVVALSYNLPAGAPDVSGGFAGTSSDPNAGLAANGESGSSSERTFLVGQVGIGTSGGSVYPTGVNGNNASNSASPGVECVPHIAKSFNPTSVSNGGESTMTITVFNPNNNTAMNHVNFIDTYPSGIVNAATPAPTFSPSCGTNPALTASAGGGTFQVASGTSTNISGNATCTFTVKVVANYTADMRTNTIAQDGVAAKLNGVDTTNEVAASATLIVPAAVSATKTRATYSDPVNNTTNPKSIPSARVDYAIQVNNPAGSIITTNTMDIRDRLPTDVKLFLGDLGASSPGGGAPVEFTQSNSTLSFTYSGPSSTTDDLEFSNLDNPNPATASDWSYTPVLDADNADAAIKWIRFRPKGSMPGSTNLSVRYRVIVK